jgi:5-methylcytosine-specific restriction endonuclease McrA
MTSFAAQKRHRIKIRKHLLDFLLLHPCVDCGEKDPIVLEFDHRIPKDKSKQVSRMLSGHYSWEKIMFEIEKCDVRCANCHRRKTHKDGLFFGRGIL